VGRFIVRRLASSLVVLAVASVVIFGLVASAPGDPAQLVAERQSFGADRETVERIRRELGLDRPLPVQYLSWVGDVARGDFGTSLKTETDIGSELGERIPVTAFLVLGGAIFTLVVGCGAGFLGALWPGSVVDRLLRPLALISVSIPSFYLAALLVLLLAVSLQWLPAEGRSGPASWWLPWFTLGLAPAAVMARVVRVTLADAMSRPYVTTALSKGRRRREILMRDALPNIAVPTMTAFAAQLGLMVTGAIVVEAVFSWHGVALYFLEAVEFRDFPVMQNWLLLFAIMFVLLNTLVDIASRAIDPRLRRAMTEGMA